MNNPRSFPPPHETAEQVANAVCRASESEIKTQRGDEIILSPCPMGGCKGDKFAINAETGLWNCPKCGAYGNSWQLIERLNMGPIVIAAPQARREPKRPMVPQAMVDKHVASHSRSIDPTIVAWLKTRGITHDTATDFGVCSDHDAIGFTYFRDNGAPAFVKWRNIKTKAMRRMPTKAEMPAPVVTPLFGPRLDTSQPVVLTEGELDCMTLAQLGLTNVASLANGASGWDSEWSIMLANTPEIWCCYDNDEHGNAAAAKLVERFGAGRVLRVVFGDHKDANAALMAGWGEQDFRASLEQAKRAKPEILISARAAAQCVADSARQGLRPEKIMTGWANFDETQQGLRPGELSVITAHSGAGKTAWTMSLALQLGERGVSCGYYTFEQGIDATAEQLLMMVSCCAVDNMDQDALDAAVQRIPENLWLGKEPDDDKLRQVEAAIEYGKVVYGTRVIVIDHLDYLVDPTPAMPRYEAATKAVKMLDLAAREHEVHIILVSQPVADSGRSRTGKPPPLTLAHTADSRAIRQLANNGWVFESKHADRVGTLYVEKARYSPAVSDVTLAFTFDGFRYHASDYSKGRQNLAERQYDGGF